MIQRAYVQPDVAYASARSGRNNRPPVPWNSCRGIGQDQAIAADPGARPSRADSGMSGLFHASFGTAALSQAL